jgi:sugar-specific transcriptional regulator TrmB
MEEFKLLQLGLNRNEAKVYRILLQLGQASAGELIKKTEFHRNIVYDNLEKLIDKGLVTFIIEGNIKIFQAAPPEMITEMLDKEQEQLNEKKKLAEELKNEAIKLKSSHHVQQEATIYRGVRGLKVLFNDTLNVGSDYYVIGAPRSSLELMGSAFWENYNLKRVQKKIVVKMLFNEDLRRWSKIIQSKKTIIKFLSKKFDGLTETIIYGNKVAFIVWTEKPIATLIQDPHLASNYRKYFHALWGQAKI